MLKCTLLNMLKMIEIATKYVIENAKKCTIHNCILYSYLGAIISRRTTELSLTEINLLVKPVLLSKYRFHVQYIQVLNLIT